MKKYLLLLALALWPTTIPDAFATDCPAGSPAGINCENYQGQVLDNVTGGTAQRKDQDRFNDHGINIKEFGAIGDGNSHPLSGIYGNLGAAQAVYPFVSDLSQEVDWAATQAAINYGYTTGVQSAFCPAVPASGDAYILSNPIQVMNSPASNISLGNGAWQSGTTYNKGDGVLYNGINWTSLAGGNIGNPPTSVSGYPANLKIASNGTQVPFANVTVTNSSTTVNLTNHGFSAGQALIFFKQTYTDVTYGSPALPTGLSADTVYYVLSAGLTANTFEVSATPGGSAITFSSAGSGVITVGTQVWLVNPIGSPDFGNRANFIGDPGQNDSSVGCIFKFNGYTTTAIETGAYNGNLIQSISVNGPGSNLGDYRCQMPSGTTNNLFSSGVGNVSDGAGTHRTTYDKVQSIGFSEGWRSTIGGGGTLGDSNTFLNGHYSSNCIGLEVNSQENFINSAYDVTIDGDNTAVSDTLGVGFHVYGGNDSASSGIQNSFAVTGVSVSTGGNDVFIVATVTSPDGFLTYPMCGYNTQCTYGVMSVVTAHYGVVATSIIGFNPATNVINLKVNHDQLAPYNNTGPGTDFQTDLGAITRLYAAETVTVYEGSVTSKGVHVENAAVPTTLISSFTSFNGAPSRIEDTLLDYDPSGADYICCNSNPSNGQLAAFYAQQNISFINISDLQTVIDNVPGGNIKTWDRVLFEGGSSSSYGEFRHTAPATPSSGGNGVNPEGPGLLWNQRFVSSDTFDGSFAFNLQTNYNWAFGSGATGGGLWDTGGPWVSGAWTSADQWKSLGWGTSHFVGSRPDFNSTPCVLPSQVAALASPPAITYAAQLQFINMNSAGSSYQAGDTITLVGGTSSPTPTVTVNSVDGSGHITGYSFNENSNQYTVSTTSFTSTGGHGSGATWIPAPLPTQAWYVNYSVGYPMLYGGVTYHLCDWHISPTAYNGGTTYGQGDIVTSSAVTYLSLVNSNTGNTPASSPSDWQVLKYGYLSNNTAYSYFQNLTTANVPNLSWSSYSDSPVVYMNVEALELMFPGLVISLTGSSSAPCNNSGTETFIITEVNPSLGYVKVLNAGQNGSPYLPQWGSGNTCTGTTIAQASPNIVNPY